MRTHGHREGSITHWGLCGGWLREGQRGVGRLGVIAWGEMPVTGDGWMEEANHLAKLIR